MYITGSQTKIKICIDSLFTLGQVNTPLSNMKLSGLTSSLREAILSDRPAEVEDVLLYSNVEILHSK